MGCPLSRPYDDRFPFSLHSFKSPVISIFISARTNASNDIRFYVNCRDINSKCHPNILRPIATNVRFFITRRHVKCTFNFYRYRITGNETIDIFRELNSIFKKLIFENKTNVSFKLFSSYTQPRCTLSFQLLLLLLLIKSRIKINNNNDDDNSNNSRYLKNFFKKLYIRLSTKKKPFDFR